MARKKDEFGAREKTVHFRVSEAFYEVIAHEARQCGLSISEFCRCMPHLRFVKRLNVETSIGSVSFVGAGVPDGPSSAFVGAGVLDGPFYLL